MPTTVEAGFATYLARLTPSATAVSAASKHRQSVKDALTPLGLDRFFQIGSFNHGTGVHPYSDVDYLATFTSLRPASSDTALAWVRDRLRAAFPLTTVEVRRPAVVVRFAAGAEIFEVVPGWFKRTEAGHSVYEIPGAASGWIESSPESHLSYVNACNQAVGGGKAKGLARLAKAWKYECNVPVSSFYLEMRAAKYAKDHKPVIYGWDLRGLFADMASFPAMNDPQGIVGRIYATSSETKKVDASSKLTTAKGRADKARSAEDAGNTVSAFAEWNKVLGGKFPAYG